MTMDILEEKKERGGFRNEFSSFASEISVVGVRYIFLPSTSIFRRSCWTLLVLTGTVFRYVGLQPPFNHIIFVSASEKCMLTVNWILQILRFKLPLTL